MSGPPRAGARFPGPERVAGALSGAVLLFVVVSLAIGSAGNGSTNPSPSPGSSAPATPSATSAVDANAIELIHGVNRRLTEAGRLLEAALVPVTLDVPGLQAILREMNPHLALGIDAAGRLQARETSRATGLRVAQVYGDLRSTIEATLQASVRNEAAYRAGAQALLARLADLPALDVDVAALLDATPAPSAEPTPLPSVTLSPGPSPTPSASAEPSSSPSPSWTAPPSSGLLANGGFESVIGPWQVAIAPGAAAEATLDRVNPSSGQTSLRVTIVTSGLSRQTIVVRQSDVTLLPRTRYQLTLRARAEVARTIRVGVASAAGAPYASTLGSIGPVWTTVDLEFLAIAGDSQAVVAIELGGDDATTWLDDVVLVPLVP